MGRSPSWSVIPFVTCALVAQQRQATDATLRPPAQRLAEVVLASLDDGLHIAEFGLGDGGTKNSPRGAVRWSEHGCTTAGGVRVECHAVGVKLTFTSGCELLIAPDGNVHLRSGELAGPFPTGLELLLADGSSVRVVLSPSARERVREVLVSDGNRVLQPWRRGEPASEVARSTRWPGLRFVCCGDGGDVYRAIALGPLIALDRVLVAKERADSTPRERLVVLATPLVQSLAVMSRQHREPLAALRQAVTTVAAVADRGSMIFPAAAQLQRAERDRLRWLLRGGFELQIALDGPLAPRLQLFAGDSPLPMVEWTLRGDSAAFLTNPCEDQKDQRWHGNGTRLGNLVPGLQAREELFERVHAVRLIERLQR